MTGDVIGPRLARTCLAGFLFLFLADVSTSRARPHPLYQQPATPAATNNLSLADLPRAPSKWFQGFHGYSKALSAQKDTGRDIFIYFARPNTPREKGLCRWLENKGIKSLPVRKILRQYIKVRVDLPGNPGNQKLARKFHVHKTPAVFIQLPNGWRNRCTTFDWSNRRPKLLTPEELVELFVSHSSAVYQPLAEKLREKSK